MSLLRHGRSSRARSQARKLAMQALYQWQLTQQSAEDIESQFVSDEEFGAADREYFHELIDQCITREQELDQSTSKYVDRPLDQLDPVERAILLIGMYELEHRLEIPYRVVINEAVELGKRFGATDAHKYLNAVLDRASKEKREAERN
ncbi:MAG: transcription antitermination factor NusB [Steroidobacteraceae bacterium]